MTDLVDVTSGDLITSASHNLIKDYINDGVHKINTLSIDVGSTEVITAARALTNLTFPTLNQDTTGSANSLKSPTTTGVITVTGPTASTTRSKTVRDANDTILELGGNYTPTGSWTNMQLVTPTLGTPASGTLTNCTFPTLNQDTTGSALSVKANGTTGVMQITGPAAGSTRVMTIPNANATLLTSANAVTVAQGGTGLTTLTLNSYYKGNGTTAPTARTYAEVKEDLSLNNVTNNAQLPLTGGTMTGKIIGKASDTTSAPFNIPHGAAPTSPVNGDLWSTTAAPLMRINGTSRTIYHSGNASTAALTTATQAEAEAGTSTTVRGWTPQRVAQAIAALASGSGASACFERKIEGDLYTTTLMPIIFNDSYIGKKFKECRISVASLPTGASIKMDVRKNGTATTDSQFTSDVPIEILTTQTATNGLYQTGCTTAGATVGTPGTTIDSARDTIAADDVYWLVITQVGSTLAGTDLSIFVTVE